MGTASAEIQLMDNDLWQWQGRYTGSAGTVPGGMWLTGALYTGELTMNTNWTAMAGHFKANYVGDYVEEGFLWTQHDHLVDTLTLDYKFDPITGEITRTTNESPPPTTISEAGSIKGRLALLTELISNSNPTEHQVYIQVNTFVGYESTYEYYAGTVIGLNSSSGSYQIEKQLETTMTLEVVEFSW